jgi:CRISPR-associated protein Csx10
MKTITFLLHTKQSVLVTSLQGDPNSDVSFSYIPGSVIRGALIGRYLQLHGLQKSDDILDDIKFSEIKKLFFNGDTRYLNAYLYSSEQEKRTLPVPRSWLKKKNDNIYKLKEISVYDFSYEQPRDDISYKSLDEGFCTVNDNDIVLYKEQRRINIHNMRNRKKGRGIEGSGAVFRYDALDAEQIFQAVILCDNSEDVDKIKALLEVKEIWLGGSQSAGYGHTQIIYKGEEDEHDNWYEVGSKPEERENRELLRITLLSDLILRDKWGHYVATPPKSTENENNREVNPLTQQLKELLNINLQIKSSYASSLIIGGFNRKWGLPLPQVPALAAGSVFVFKYNGQINIEQIRSLENKGIGERLVDGFGRIAISWLEEYPTFNASLPKSEMNWDEPRLTSNTIDCEIAQKMAKRLLEQKLDIRLLEKIDSINFKKNKLKNSQLSRLMIVARQALTEESKNPVLKLLESLPKNAKTQFEDATINNKSLKSQIFEWVENPSGWIDSQHLAVNIAGESISSDIVNKLKLEYTLRLIIAVAKQAMKDKKYE